MQNFYDLSYPEAVSHLLDGEQGRVHETIPKPKEQPRKAFALPPANDNMRRVYAYLLKRRLLDRDVVTAFAKAGLLYESCEKFNDREIHNAVFVGKDEHGVARHAHKRSVNDIGKSFRINIEGSDPRYSFQGMAVKLGIHDIGDFIDLTFCCQEATVITDFSNLDKIGKEHLMTVNGGCMPTAEHDRANCQLAALDLICNHEGHVTPYGVVYDNGMKLDQLYDGRHFPGYYYEQPVLAFEAVSDEGGFTGLLSLPMPERQLTRLMQRAEAERADVHLMVSADALPEKVSEALDLEHLTSEDLYGLNRLCKSVEFFNDYGREKLNAAVLLTETSGIISLCRLAENIDMFDFVPNVHTAEEYGRYMIQRSGRFGYDENLDGFYDYDGYGARRVQEEGGQFNDLGYVAYKGTIPLEEFLLHGNKQHGPEMGSPC